MSGTPNPSVNIREVNGSLRTSNDRGEGTILKLGTGSAYLRHVPVRCGSLTAVSQFGVGTAVSSACPQVEFGQRGCYVMQVDGSTAGTFGAVTKLPAPDSVPQSPASMALSAASFSARTDGNALPEGAALAVTTGFASPPSPLKGTIVVGTGGVAHTATWVYYNEAGELVTDAITISGVGTFSTTQRVKQTVSYTTSVDPEGTTTLTHSYAGPLDRFDHIRIKTVAGGQISVSGAVRPQIQWSADDGESWSSSLTVPSTGIVDLYTYAGGFTKWHTGMRCTFTQGTVASSLFGAYRAAGATTNGDLIATFAKTGATFEVVVNTVPTSLSFSVTGDNTQLIAETTGGVAASYAGFGSQMAGVTFTAGTVGTGGNAITIAFVADGTGAGSKSIVGNAITIHYQDGVTTVAQVKALFPAAATFASVTVSGGTNANVLAAPGDTHAATNLASGANATVVTTGQAAVNFFNTDTSANTLAARALVQRLTIVGTGAGLLATAASTGGPNGGIAWTSKKPLVKVRHLVSGNNTVEDILVSGGDGVNSIAYVTIVSATDAAGAQTSTPNSVLATLAAKTSAAALVSGTVTGAGTGIVGNWDYVTMISALAAGDQWTSYTTPPMMTLADLQTAWQILRTQYQKTFSNVELVQICQDDCSDLIAQSFDSWLQGLKDDKKIPLWGVVNGLYKAPSYTTDSAWSTAFISALPSPRFTKLAICGGRIDTIVTLYGCQLAMNCSTLFMARCMNTIISQSASQPRCAVRSTDGTQYALPGTGLHSVGDGSTDERTAIWEGDDALLELHAQNVATPRTLPKKDGVFIRQTLMYADDGNQMIYWERRRIMNRAFNITSAVLTDELNRAFLTNPDATIAEIDAQQLERAVRASISSGGLLNDGGVNHVSGYDFSISRVELVGETENVECALSIRPRAKAVTISETMGFAITQGG